MPPVAIKLLNVKDIVTRVQKACSGKEYDTDPNALELSFPCIHELDFRGIDSSTTLSVRKNVRHDQRVRIEASNFSPAPNKFPFLTVDVHLSQKSRLYINDDRCRPDGNMVHTTHDRWTQVREGNFVLTLEPLLSGEKSTVILVHHGSLFLKYKDNYYQHWQP